MNRNARLGLGLAGSLLLTGCFDVEQTLVLQKDLSGKAGFSMKVSLEPMVSMMLMMQRSMEGKEGDPTPEELAQARKDFLAKSSSESKPDPEQQKADLAKSLPAGVTLLDSRFQEKELDILAAFTLGFDDVHKLKQVRLDAKPAEGEAAGPPGPPNPFDTPFGDLEVTDEGGTFLLTTKATNPLEEQKEEMGGPEGVDPEMAKQLEQAFKDLRVAWKIEAPFEVLESNAHRREGKTLIWEYTLDSMKDMDPAKAAEGIRVRYKKG
ncbi:MAG TPA: hypothetical protein DD490_15430 [Acidobacteria bacterium]|nr:hypothetical protein [Acidobacteriota bacterium]